MFVFEIVGYQETALCSGCEKEKECVVIKTEAFTAPTCEKCTMREARKRAKNGNVKSTEQ